MEWCLISLCNNLQGHIRTWDKAWLAWENLLTQASYGKQILLIEESAQQYADKR